MSSHASPAAKAKAAATEPGAASVSVGWWKQVPALLPGVVVSLVAALVAWGLAQLMTGVSPLLVAILLGVLWCNVAQVPAILRPGVAFSAKHVLRAGIVLLGLKLSLGAIVDLGAGVIIVVVVAVGVTFGSTVLMGRWLKVSTPLTLLIASGFSICGAAAVAGADGVLKAKKEQVAAAIGLVVLFGTLMIPTIPFLASVVGLDAEAAGLWAGASSHEVAHAVAAGGAIGGGALAVAVTVKLARVLMLAPVMAGLAWRVRRSAAVGARQVAGDHAKLPPLVPGFIIGFFVMVLVRTVGVVGDDALASVETLQTLLLTAAMFALGLGVNLASLAKLGVRPVLLGAISTVVILTIGGVGAILTA